MPRSRSRSFESSTRSRTSWLARKTPLCLQHGVDEGRLAMVDVGDDGDVPDLHGSPVRLARRAGG